MARSTNFQPNWASPPGDTIADVLEDRGIAIDSFAAALNHSMEFATDLISGHRPITQEVAEKLQSFLGASVAFWLTREMLYRRHSARLAHQTYLSDARSWLNALPLKDMIDFAWVTLPADLKGKISACLAYFDVPDVSGWRDRYGDALHLAAYRTSPTFEAEPGAVSAWFRQGEIKSEVIECAPWNADLFRTTLIELRALTKKKEPDRFLAVLQKACAACGVAVVIVPTPSGCRASGATKFIRPDRALMLLSFRYRSDDHFWFTFFHKAGHLLLHGNTAFFLEETRKDRTITDEEREANAFARDMLIPPALQPALRTLPTRKRDIVRFAMEVGVSPGIVAGQLQHMGRVSYERLNGYKRRYDWDKIPV
jgi:plasmid maintenance system antidote protein VapI/Zn-dependent peptidase ImmA (M78 family)